MRSPGCHRFDPQPHLIIWAPTAFSHEAKHFKFWKSSPAGEGKHCNVSEWKDRENRKSTQWSKKVFFLKTLQEEKPNTFWRKCIYSFFKLLYREFQNTNTIHLNIKVPSATGLTHSKCCIEMFILHTVTIVACITFVSVQVLFKKGTVQLVHTTATTGTFLLTNIKCFCKFF